MTKTIVIIVFLLFVELLNIADCKRGFSLSVGRKKSSSSGWLSTGRRSSNNNAPSAPVDTKPASSMGWNSPGGNTKTGGGTAAGPGGSSSYGWNNPNNKGNVNSHQPSSNIGPGGYPVQGGVQKSPPPYSPTNTHGTSINQGRVAPPAYSPTNPHNNPPSYNSQYPKKQVVNNHYHYSGPPPQYSQASHFGMGSSYYPQQNSFGYPGGYGNSRPSYGGMGLFSSGRGSYGYPGSGSWGGMPSYGGGSSGSGSMVKGMLIGAAGGYLVSALVRKVTNPWGYSGSGYGQGYTDRYRDAGPYDRDQPTPAPIVIDPTKDWINCVAFDPATRVTMINPNCSCTVTVTTDPISGQNTSHHDCTPFAQGAPPPFAPQPPIPIGENNPPPSFNSSLYQNGYGYGGDVPYLVESTVTVVEVTSVLPVTPETEVPTTDPPEVKE